MANSRAALEEARSVRTAVESLSTELRKSPPDTENHQRRAIVLSTLTVALAVLSVWLIALGAAGFSDPSPSPTFGNVGVAVETGGPPTDELGLPFDDIPTFGVAGYSLSLFGDDALLTSSVVATKRDIETTATTLVAFGGALIGLAIGFVPVVYEAARAARRQRHST